MLNALLNTQEQGPNFRMPTLEEMTSRYSPENIQAILKQHREKFHRSPQQVTEDLRARQEAKHFIQQIKNDRVRFSNKIEECKAMVDKRISQTFEIVKETSKCTETVITTTNDKVKEIQENIIKTKAQIVTEQKWLERTRAIQILESDQQEREIQNHNKTLQSCEQLNELIAIFNNTIEQREQRIARVQQFFKKNKASNFTVSKPQKILKTTKVLPDSNKTDIEFLPEKKELIFNIWTFERQIVQFILFFDPENKKFGLKNPSKTFQYADLNAVKAFNSHKSITELHQEFCFMVSKFIDDADELPQYKGY